MNTWKISGVVFCLLLASILAGQQQQNAITVIQGATVITGSGSPTIRNAAIVIDGGRIRDIGPRNEVRVPNNAQVIDARGKWVIPGLIDAHVHFNEPGRTSWEGFATGTRALAAGAGYAFSRAVCAATGYRGVGCEERLPRARFSRSRVRLL